MANIQKRAGKDGTTYRVQIRMRGFPPQTRTFDRLTDAKAWAQETESSIRRSEFKNVIREASTKTLGDVAQRYREELLPLRAASTQRAVSSCLKYWERELGEYALACIDADLISKKMRALETAGDTRRLAPASKTEVPGKRKRPGRKATRPAPAKPALKSRKTLKHYRDMIALLFKFAQQWRWTGSNPIDGVNRITKIRNERTLFLSDEERQALLAACKASENEHLYPVVVFAISTGARKSEILGLTFNDIDLKRGIAILRDTKNGETRSVPIVRSLGELLTAHLEDQGALQGDGVATAETLDFSKGGWAGPDRHPDQLGNRTDRSQALGLPFPRFTAFDGELSRHERRQPRRDRRSARPQDAPDGEALRAPVRKPCEGAGRAGERQDPAGAALRPTSLCSRGQPLPKSRAKPRMELLHRSACFLKLCPTPHHR